MDDVEEMIGGAEQVVLDRNSKRLCLTRGGEVAREAGSESMVCRLGLAGITEPAVTTLQKIAVMADD